MMTTTQRKTKMICSFFVLLFCAIVLNSPAARATPPSESELLEMLATKAISPNLGNMAATSKELFQATETLCRDKDEPSLLSARSAWQKAYLAWRRAEPFLLGPAAKLSLNKRIDCWLANDTLYKAVTSSEDFAFMRDNREYRGYAAAEYILFSETEAALTTTPIRCKHLLDVTGEIAELTASADTVWRNDFMKGFVSAGDGHPFLLPSDALSPVVAEALNSIEALLRDNLLDPSNYFKDKAKPELLEAWRSNTTGLALQATFEAIVQAFTGYESISILALLAGKDGGVNKKNPQLAADIRKQLTSIQKTISELNEEYPNLHKQLTNDKTTLKPLYKQLQKLQEQLVKATLILELDVRTGLEAQLTK